MNSAREKLAVCGIALPEILMPAEGIDHAKWAVIACDQFSSDKAYWETVKEEVGGSPSTLHMILPECYLDEEAQRVPAINRTMQSYLDEGVLKKAREGFVYLNRSTPWVSSRRGLMVALDLEEYSYEAGAACQVRPTEGTVLERLPVRAAIREKAVLDIPHILVLFDDPDDNLFRLLEDHKEQLPKLYDFEIPRGGGHLEGALVEDGALIDKLSDILVRIREQSDFLFAVGDGNHSLGAAKQLWEKIKAEGGEDVMNHPARWALVELENIHDKGLNFEPIHRVLFGVEEESFLAELEAFPGFSVDPLPGRKQMKALVAKHAASKEADHAVGLLLGERCFLLRMANQEVSLAAEAFHLFLDPWLKAKGDVEIDYIHGEEALAELSKGDGNMGFYLPGIDKSTFFSLISEKGALPRKTFSIGEAEEKRYYLECRKIIP